MRVIAHTQLSKLPNLRQKAAHVFEIQVNGGANAAEKVDYVLNDAKLFESEVQVGDIFTEGEFVDTIGATKGHGMEGVITRWGVKRLPRKSHRGLRKIACIGAWHPARVSYQTGRAGQRGYHHRTEQNKRIYKIATPPTFEEQAAGMKDTTATTDQDLTEKGINPLGGFPHYGVVRNTWVMIKGGVVGSKKRPVTLRKSVVNRTRGSKEPINLRFVDTASKFGHGRFQTGEERAKFYGQKKADGIEA